MRPKILIIVLIFFGILTFCAKQDLPRMPTRKSEINQRGAFKDIMVSKENILYLNMPSISNGLSTKSESRKEDLVSLESLLDRTRTEELDFKGCHITQVPFIEEESVFNVSLQDSVQLQINTNDITIVKKFLIEVIDTSKNKVSTFIAALIPSKTCLEKYGVDSFTYLEKGQFEGIAIYSNLDGAFRNVCFYGNGPVKLGELIDRNQANSYNTVKIVSVIRKPRETKTYNDDEGVYGGEIAGSLCVAEVERKENEEDDNNLNVPTINFGNGGGGGGSGTGSGDGSGSDVGRKDSDTIFDTLKSSLIIARRDSSDLVKYTVSLTRGGTGSGDVKGSGLYPKGRVVICKAMPHSGSYFDRWTGDFYGKDFNVTLKVENDVYATAYFRSALFDFGTARPCVDLSRDIGNPLMKMLIASPGASGLTGGTYGYVRNGGKKFHSGLDLYAEVGTSVYAMIDGEIFSEIYATEQPNKTTEKYPSGYMGDMNGAGNRIYIKGQINGLTVLIGYWHLRGGEPVAINPRTRKPYNKGDKVYRGELLAYTGRTGNAYNVAEPHLYLYYGIISKNGTRQSANPEALINGELKWNDGKNEVLGIRGIICDEEKKEEISIFSVN